MKTLFGILAMAVLTAAPAVAGTITVQRVQGDVSVRQGVTETWTRVGAGDSLKPNDTMRTGKKGSAVIVAVLRGDVTKRITLPADVIVDMSDIRDLSQEELMLKLTMEKVRASSYEWKNEDLRIPDATVVHGAQRGAATAPAAPADSGRLQWNGARVLFENGFYSTGVLKALEIFRLFPAVAAVVSNRLLIGEALEKAGLHGEALAEYGAIAQLEGLTAEQKGVVRSRMEALRGR
jgi:hypothetical protein